MSFSSLTTLYGRARYYHATRPQRIDRITIHCFVGQVNCVGAANTFSRERPDQASANYTVCTDGICCHMEDEQWSNCSSSAANDSRAITIETACSPDFPYTVRDDVYERLIDLVTDVCIRNGIKHVVWIPDKNKALSYVPKDGEAIFTWHRWFASKACPGQWIMDHQQEICDRVDRRLEEENEMMTQEQFNEMMDNYLEARARRGVSDWAKSAWLTATERGITDGTRPRSWLTREEAMQLIANVEKEMRDDVK